MSLATLSSPPFQSYTPQRHPRYTPQTPSPLRTSRNANLMPSPPTSANTYKATSDTTSSPPGNEILTSHYTQYSSFGNLQSMSSTAFQLQARSRSQSPHASLAKSNALAKTRRTSLFLDKVRRNREDARFEIRGEQSLRLEFVRERRAWEERLKSRAPIETGIEDGTFDDVDEEMEDRAVGNEDENGVPSPTEDREIEELLSFLETDVREVSTEDVNGTCHGKLAPPQRISDTMSDDDDYDQLFMEVIGDSGGLLLERSQELEAPQEPQSQDSHMDMS